MRLSTILVMALAAMTSAHMELIQPPSLRQIDNPFTTPGTGDTDLKSPLSPDGSNYPCKGHLSLLNTPQGQSVASWAAGSQQTWTLGGSTRHEGGSCQASISKDGGNTFKVIHSYIGGCPLVNSYSFTLPSDTPPGPALFAYSWHNRIGNREMYMNCASVTIIGRGGRESVPFNKRPNILRAHAGTDCKIPEGFDVEYPDPGPDVTRSPQAKLIAPLGSACGPSNSGDGGGFGVGGGGGGGVGGGGSSFGSVSPDNPSNQGGGPFADSPAVPIPGPQLGSDPSSSGDGTFGGVGGGGGDGVAPPVGSSPGPFGSRENVCGGAMRYSCINSIFGSCCNAQGQCGTTEQDCGTGCQAVWGRCMDEQGNPNQGFTGWHSSAYVAERDWTVEWMAIAIGVVAF